MTTTFIVLFLFWAALGVFCIVYFGRQAYRRWFRKRIILPAQQQEVDLNRVFELLRQLQKEKNAESGNSPMKEMLNHLDILESMIAERRELGAEVMYHA